jgi:hypothetical protein
MYVAGYYFSRRTDFILEKVREEEEDEKRMDILIHKFKK